MWYLVVPPVIVVLSLFFLVWYLLRKSNDPAIAQEVRETVGQSSSFFPRIKAFFLKGVEKLASRYKVRLLRGHNALNEFAQSVKKMRTGLNTSVPSTTEAPVIAGADSAQGDGTNQDSVDVTSVTALPVDASEILMAPIVRKERKEKITGTPETMTEKKVFTPRPTVSVVMTHPEKQKQASRKENSREESLIGRIARDPKDFTAYEELGDYYLEAGNIKDAKECYRQVLKLSPVHRLVKIKIRRLEKLLTRGGE